MKKPQFFLSLLFVPMDWLALVLAAIASYYLRFTALAELRPIIFEIPFYQYTLTAMIIALSWLPIFALSGLYSPSSKREFIKILFASTVGIMGIILVIFFRHELFSSRFIILAVWFFSFIFVWLERKIMRALHYYLLRKTKIYQKIILIGQSEKAEKFSELLKERTDYRLIDWIKDSTMITNQYLQEKKKDIDEIIVLDNDLTKEEKERLLLTADEKNIPFRYLADSFDVKPKQIAFEIFFGFPLISIKRTVLDDWGRVAKRIFDIIGSVFALIVLSPFFIFVPIIIKIDSRGSVFVRLRRVGRRGGEFDLIKFRSMVENAEAQKKNLLAYSERKGPLFKMKNDPRVTKFGKFIRRTSIDEIPQFVNVLRGEMSLVGPRPHEPGEVSQYEKYQKNLLFIKPGVTGLAQLYGRSNLPFEEEAKIDLRYVENWSIWKDFEIILKTIPLVIFRKGAA